MRKSFLFCLLIAIIFQATSVYAAFFSESLIYVGPPNYEAPYDSGNRPTQVSANLYGKDADVTAGWWNLGGNLTTTWDENFQGWIYLYALVEKEFEVTGIGNASVDFSWNGFLQVSGSTAQNWDYELYATAEVYDDTPDPDNYDYLYEWLSTPGRVDVSETITFDYNFSDVNVGDIITISMIFQAQVSPEIGTTLDFEEGEQLDFISSFQNGLKINNLSGEIAAVDGPNLPAPVPLPSSIWFLTLAIAASFFIKQKR